MIRLDDKELLALGKKHKKWNEAVTMEKFPYVIEGSPYFLAYYHGRFSTTTKEIAIVSPNSSNKEHAYKAMKPLLYFTVTFNNLDHNTRARAELDFDVLKEVRDYLRNVLESGNLDQGLIQVYQRSFDIIDNMLALQDEMVELRKVVNGIAQGILERGYFTDEDMEKVFELFPAPGWIQYQQFYERYQHRTDFDIIYENSMNPGLKRFHTFKDNKTLYYMTSKMAENSFKKSLANLSDNTDMTNYTKEDFYDYWLTKYKRELAIRFEELRNKIRFP